MENKIEKEDKDLSGILIVDKEKGMTSHDVVACVRKAFSLRKVGHAGTLDPMATGVLVLLLGRCTKLSAKFLNDDKGYEAVMKLGEATSTGDSEGDIVSSSGNIPAEEMIRDVVYSFYGDIEQVPPMTSAKKIKGKKLYKLARKGISIEREPVKVTIKEIKAERMELPLVYLRVLCSKGTYIRQLAEDIGVKLGCGAHLTDLRRVRSGDFSIEQAAALSDIMKMDREQLYESIIRVQGS